MKEYLVRPFEGLERGFAFAERIGEYPWGGGYRPEAEFSLTYDDTGLYLGLRAREKAENIRAVARGLARDVWHDSCLECFLMPDPEHDARYLNLEFNPAGALRLSLGTARGDRVDPEGATIEDFCIAPFREQAQDGLVLWGVTARLDAAFLKRVFPALTLLRGQGMRGNFYKCGEKTPEPHYACWARVTAQAPDFHRPESFGALTLV